MDTTFYEIALRILIVYFILAVISSIFDKRRKKKMLKLQAETVELKVDNVVIPKEEWSTFDKKDYVTRAIQYTIEYDHPMDTENKTQYIIFEIIREKESRLIQKTEVPLDRPFDILVNAKKPQKVELGVELSLKKKVDEKIKKLEEEKKNK